MCIVLEITFSRHFGSLSGQIPFELSDYTYTYNNNNINKYEK